jgi:hypothetical protein
MTSSTLKALGCVLLALSATVLADAQNQLPKKTSTISGKVTVRGTGIPGITVGAVAYASNMRGGKTSFGGVTDSQGNYRISDLPAATYDVAPATPQYVLASLNMRKRVIVEEGESLDGVDFLLVRGGVITGKVTNTDGQPVLEQQIHVDRVEDREAANEMLLSLNMAQYLTDDRGVYRVFGLPPGKYRVSAGIQDGVVSFGGRGIKYKQTYHPSATDPARATVIEVGEGSEATNVDIVFNRRELTYSVSGWIVDGETSKPLANIRYGLTKLSENGSSGMSGPTTTASGEFRFDSLTPGKYLVSIETSADWYGEPVRFEVIDEDVTNIILKTSKGASISGVVLFEGVDLKTSRTKYGELMIVAQSAEDEKFMGRRSAPPAMVGPDGSFTATGVRPGLTSFWVFSRSGDGGREFDITRIERDGVPQSRTIEVREREQITGMRLIVNPRTGVLQGSVKVENGQIPMERVWVSLQKSGDAERSGYGVPLDARGRFRLNGIAAGTYDLTAWAYLPESGNRAMAKQQVVITGDQPTDVTLVMDLKAAVPPGRP